MTTQEELLDRVRPAIGTRFWQWQHTPSWVTFGGPKEFIAAGEVIAGKGDVIDVASKKVIRQFEVYPWHESWESCAEHEIARCREHIDYYQRAIAHAETLLPGGDRS